MRKEKFDEIQTIKNNFSAYEKALYYKSDTLSHPYNLTIGANYALNDPVQKSEKLLNDQGFKLVYHVSGSNDNTGHMDLFKDKYADQIGDKTALEYFASLNNKELSNLLENDGLFAAAMAGFKVVTTFDAFNTKGA